VYCRNLTGGFGANCVACYGGNGSDRPLVTSDYKREDVVGHAIVEALGGEVVLIDLVPGQSTTSMVERSRGAK